MRLKQNGQHFSDDIFKGIYWNENVWISLKVSLKFVPKVRINNIAALVQIKAWRRPGDKPLSEPMMVILLMHICVPRPQRVKKEISVIIYHIKSRWNPISTVRMLFSDHHRYGIPNDLLVIPSMIELSRRFHSNLIELFSWFLGNLPYWFLGHHYCEISRCHISTMATQIIGDLTFCSKACSLIKLATMKHQSSVLLAFVTGIHHWLVDFPHIVPVIHEAFPYHEIWIPLTKGQSFTVFLCHDVITGPHYTLYV